MKKANGENTPFRALNLFADSLCMFLQDVLYASGTMDYYVPEARPNIWHYAVIYLDVSSISQDLKIWKLHRCLKLSMVSRLLFVSAVADILANRNRGCLYGFKA